MTITAAFTDLYEHLGTLQELLIGLRTTAVEDKPLQGDDVLVDVFGDAADDMLGLLEEALVAVCRRHSDLESARRALVTCQEQHNRLTHRFTFDVFSYERLATLMRSSRQRGGEWYAWANSVKQGLERCQQSLYDVNQTLFRCWQEITEQVSMTSLSVQTTNIGQQITLPDQEVVKEAFLET
jgi:hypothetical protein